MLEGGTTPLPPVGRLPARGQAFAGRLALALLTGVVFTCYSELSFWARPIQGTLPPDVLLTTLVYAMAAYAFLTTVAAFRVRSMEALFLAGAVYGWLVEGVIVQTLYDDFPFNLSWTGLAWHALITILFGWYALPRALRQPNPCKAAAWAGLAGLVNGVWAMGWWSEAPPPTPLANFAVYVFATTAALAGAYGAGSRLKLPAFAPGRVEIVTLCTAIAAYFLLVTLPAQPLAAILLPPLAGVVLLSLRRNAQREPGADLVTLSLQSEAIPWRRLLTLGLMPLTATSVYALALRIDWRPPTGILLYAITTPLGFVLLVVSVVRIWRRPSPPRTGVGG